MTEAIHNYPRPAIPLSPIFSRHSASFKHDRVNPLSILQNRFVLQLTSGRAAIALALEHAGVGAGDEVLIPAFHCESMVSPARWLGAKPVFFRVHPNTAVNLEDIESKITGKTRAILVTHYFGFLQQLDEISNLCRSHGIRVIEDCAHAFFGSNSQGRNVGSTGDYAVASSMKFFPVYDGGVLASNTQDLSALTLESSPLSFHIKSLFHLLESSLEYERLGLPGRVLNILIHLKEYAWNSLKHYLGEKRSATSTPSSSDGGYGLDEEWIRKRVSLPSSCMLQKSDQHRIVTKRRANYLKLHQNLESLEGCRPLFTELPENTVPLVYPLYVEQPDRCFAALKNQGVPIWRFGEYLDDEITAEVCSASIDLSAKIFQFPCHQELKVEELNWLIETISNTMVHCNNKDL